MFIVVQQKQLLNIVILNLIIKNNSRSYFDIKNIRHPLIERIRDDV